MIDDIIEVLLALGADIIDDAIKEAREQDEEESRTYYAKALEQKRKALLHITKRKKNKRLLGNY